MLNANYMKSCLSKHYDIYYKSKKGMRAGRVLSMCRVCAGSVQGCPLLYVLILCLVLNKLPLLACESVVLLGTIVPSCHDFSCMLGFILGVGVLPLFGGLVKPASCVVAVDGCCLAFPCSLIFGLSNHPICS